MSAAEGLTIISWCSKPYFVATRRANELIEPLVLKTYKKTLRVRNSPSPLAPQSFQSRCRR